MSYIPLPPLGQSTKSASLPVTLASDQGNISASVTPTTGTLTDGSSTITAGGTAQTVFTSNSSRKYLLVQNVSSGNLWVNFGTTAVQTEPSIQLLPGGSITFEAGFVDTESVSIIGATTGQAFTAKQS